MRDDVVNVAVVVNMVDVVDMAVVDDVSLMVGCAVWGPSVVVCMSAVASMVVLRVIMGPLLPEVLPVRSLVKDFQRQGENCEGNE